MPEPEMQIRVVLQDGEVSGLWSPLKNNKYHPNPYRYGEKEMMLSKKCPRSGCDKIIEGYNDKHVAWLLAQHALSHKMGKRRRRSDFTCH